MTTRRPMRPISEKGVMVEPDERSWFDKMNSNGDLSNLIVQLALLPIFGPYVLVVRTIKNFLKD